MKRKTDQIGIITLGDKVHVSDPCYETGCWCAGTLENVKPGRYLCKIVRVEEEDCFGPPIKGIFSRVKSLTICHEDHKARPREITSIDVGVDSGQAGFYAADYYQRTHPKKRMEHLEKSWYDRICNITRKRVPNPEFMSIETYAKEELGIEFVTDEELGEAYVKVHKGLITEEQLKELRNRWLEVKMRYDEEYSCRWPTIEVGYAGILDDRCCVASSGYGDGSYDCYVARDTEGKIVAATLKFI